MPLIIVSTKIPDKFDETKLGPRGIYWIFINNDHIFFGPYTTIENAVCPNCLLLSLCSDKSNLFALQTSSAAEAISERIIAQLPIVEESNWRNAVHSINVKNGSIDIFKNPIKHPACKHVNVRTASTSSVALTDKHIIDRFRDPTSGVIRKMNQLSSIYPEYKQKMGYEVVFSWFQNPVFPLYPEVGQLDLAIGTGKTTVEAKKLALYETLERYSVLSPPQNDVFLEEKYEKIKTDAVNPEEFWGYLKRQEEDTKFPLRNIPKDKKIKWRKFYEYTGKEKWLPQDHAYVNQWILSSSSDVTTSGCAAHSSLDEAELRATLELIERDCIMRHWISGLGFPHVRVDSLPAEISSYINRLQNFGFSPHIIDVSLYKGIYCFAVCLENRKSLYPSLLVASGASLEPEEALSKALREVIGSLSITSAIYKDKGKGETINSYDVRSPEEHGIFYRDPFNKNILKHYLTPASEREFKKYRPYYDKKQNKKKLLVAINRDLRKKYGIRLFYADQAINAFKHTGVNVIRCVSPELMPLTFGTGYLKLRPPNQPPRFSEDALLYPHPYS